MGGRGQRIRSGLCLVTSASASASASGDLWRAAGTRLWPPPLLLIGRPRGERRRAWCEGRGRGGGHGARARWAEARVKRPGPLSLEAAATGKTCSPKKTPSRSTGSASRSQIQSALCSFFVFFFTVQNASPLCIIAELYPFVDLQEGGRGFWWRGLGVCRVK